MRVCAEISLSNLIHNYRLVRGMVPCQSGIMAVVKADAYSHGAVPVAQALAKEGADFFGVATAQEGLELRAAGIKTPILILGYAEPHMIRTLVENDITLTVYDLAFAQKISEAGVNARVHIKIDTGMTRLGFQESCSQTAGDVLKVAGMRGLSVEGIFTHFAEEGDSDFTSMQFEKFMDFCGLLESRGLPIKLKHASNSEAVIKNPKLSLNLVRPGIILYGCQSPAMLPVMSLKAVISQVKEVPANTGISYSREFFTKRKSRIATVPVGYADGYSRLLSNKGRAIVNNAYAPVVGNVCMDQLMLDVTHVPDAKAGDEVILLGRSESLSVSAEYLASLQGTISYEVLCGIGKRVPRVYVD